jgi:hypothetical protein
MGEDEAEWKSIKCFIWKRLGPTTFADRAGTSAARTEKPNTLTTYLRLMRRAVFVEAGRKAMESTFGRTRTVSGCIAEEGTRRAIKPSSLSIFYAYA